LAVRQPPSQTRGLSRNVSKPTQRDAIDFAEFTGRTDAVNNVSIIPRVTGHIVRAPFQDGAEVHTGDVLFDIEERPYKAQFDQSLSQVSQVQKQRDFAKDTLERYKKLKESSPGAVSEYLFNQYEAAAEEAEARLEAQKKGRDIYQLNRDFTHVRAPIDGIVSRRYLTEGNIVNQDQTLLATIVSLDPIYVYFDVDDLTLLRIREAINAGTSDATGSGVGASVQMQLQDENGQPHTGALNYVNNQVNPATGTIVMRGIFDNPTPAEMAMRNVAMVVGSAAEGQLLGLPGLLPGKLPARGTRLLSPGMFVRVRMPISKHPGALLVLDRLIQSEQKSKFVWVLDKDNKAKKAPVTTGALQEDGLRRVVGISKDDRIIVQGLPQVREGMEIKPREVPMPTLPSAPEPQPSPAERP
jgi:multidrug efflux system membrane fusion protein